MKEMEEYVNMLSSFEFDFKSDSDMAKRSQK